MNKSPATIALDRSRRLEAVVVVDTKVVPTRDRLTVCYYEIHVAPYPGARPAVLVTRSEDLYRKALEAEGTDARFTVHYHGAKRDGRYVHVLDAAERES